MIKKIILIILFTLFVSCSSKAIYNKNLLSINVKVEQIKDFYSIIPNCYEMTTGFIFYPGGLVQPEAYLPFLVKLAEEANIAIFLPKMPFNLAFFSPQKASKILLEYNYINNWYISGHSLGGVMASNFVYNNPEKFIGLILVASYPLESKSLNNQNIKVLSISGSQDGLVTREKIKESSEYLPASTDFFEIQGANHSGFGSYGEQKGDNKASITKEDQIEQVIIKINNFIN